MACHALHGSDDPRVGAASTQVTIQRADDLRHAWVRGALQQRVASHQHAGRAEPALKRPVIDEGLLERVKRAATGQAFDRPHVLTGHLGHRQLTGRPGTIIHQDGARTAQSVTASELRTGQLKVGSQDPEETSIAIDVQTLEPAVQREGNRSRRSHHISP